MFCAIATVLAWHPTSAVAQDAVELSAYFSTGFAGRIQSLETDESLDLDPAVGAGVRIGFPVHRYVVVGGMLDFSAWRPGVSGAERGYFVDPQAFVGARLPLDAGSFEVTPYAIVPVGLAVAVPNAAARDLGAKTGFGAAVGFLAGTQVMFTPRIGAMLELGMTYHRYSYRFEVSGTSGDIDFSNVQARFDAGLVVRL